MPSILIEHTGPVVRVTRGKSTSVEGVDRGVGALLDRQADGVRSAGRAIGSLR